MKSIPRKFLRALGLSVVLACAGSVAAEDLAAAIAGGRVTATFHGNGGSSGDAIELVVSRTAKAGTGTLSLTVEPGTRLQSRVAADQSMVIAGVRGLSTGGDSYEPSSVIEISDQESRTYFLEGYCMEFEKENPSSGTTFSISSPDPVIACILNHADGLSTEAKQAAVWIHTDHAGFEHVNEKFNVSKEDWAAAEAVIEKCQAPGKKEAPAEASDSSAKSNAK
jgi:hypothetical protein